MKLAELKKKSLAELSKILQESLREQFNLRMQNGASSLVKNCRQTIARVKTLQTQLMKAQVGGQQ